MSTNVISINAVSKSYRLYNSKISRLKEALSPLGKIYHREFRALENINMTVSEGEIVGIVGLNGCGKSTLLKLIAGILEPTSGELSVKGKVTALLELGAGFNPDFTGLENIDFYSRVLGATNDQLESKRQAIIEFADIGSYIDQPLRTFSSGMKARLAFAVACHVDAEILILDEILAVGDVQFRRKCYTKIDEMFRAGKTILLVSHDSNSINKLCSRAIHIHSGRVINDGTPRLVTRLYEKLVLSQGSQEQAVLEEIRKSAENELESCGGKEDSLPEVEAWYSLDLSKVDSLSYPSKGANISEPKILDLEGTEVNVLVHGKKYAFHYFATFSRDCELVSFGMQIKDESGVQVSGAASHHVGELVEICSEGSRYNVNWSFECLLLPGIYYTNAGVSRTISGGREFLARMVDATCFKVVPEEEHATRGIVSLNQRLTLSNIERP